MPGIKCLHRLVHQATRTGRTSTAGEQIEKMHLGIELSADTGAKIAALPSPAFPTKLPYQNNRSVDVKALVSIKLLVWYWFRVLVNFGSSIVVVALIMQTFIRGWVLFVQWILSVFIP